ncbi:hypothetical protein JOQ06_017379, partial [Pogonophryne albipinna]
MLTLFAFAYISSVWLIGGSNVCAVTKGLSQKVSSCCGLKAYNELNDICCESNIAAKPGPNAKCCGKVAFDVDKQLCCGPKGSKEVVPKTSTEHRQVRLNVDPYCVTQFK